MIDDVYCSWIFAIFGSTALFCFSFCWPYGKRLCWRLCLMSCLRNLNVDFLSYTWLRSVLPSWSRCHASAARKMTLRDPVIRPWDQFVLGCFVPLETPLQVFRLTSSLPKDVLVTAISANPMPDGNVCHQAGLVSMTHYDTCFFVMILVVTTMFGYSPSLLVVLPFLLKSCLTRVTWTCRRHLKPGEST